MQRKQIAIIVAIAAALVGGVMYFTYFRSAQRAKNVKQIQLQQDKLAEQTTPQNEGPVSPLSGIACANWNRRPLAFMQPADVPARPAAGFSQADIVFEIPVITATITRLMGVYVCNDPEELGSMRSARHDFVHLAKSLDAIFVHWGRSDIPEFKDRLNEGVIDNLNCNGDAGKSAANYCFRKEGMSRGVDSGYMKFTKALEAARDYGYRMENKFVGYPHQAEPAENERANGGHLRLPFPGPFAVEYDYDKASNTWLRTWGNKEDFDRNNNQRLAPKNVVAIIAKSEQIEGQYNNVQLGDPWYDTTDSGAAYYYINGQETRGSWKKDRSKIDSKLFFFDESGSEIKFVPGQIWVEVMEPGQEPKWAPNAN